MAPLILHNVPDEELYVGDDGVKRPYAMVFPQQEGLPGSVRARRGVAETGSFGKSTRRSRSRTGTPSAARREDPTLAAADKIFGDWVSHRAAAPSNNNATATPAATSSSTAAPQRKTSGHNLLSQADEAASAGSTKRPVAKPEPTEVILRGYRTANQQYSAISHYENLAGRICEDYPRDPPPEQRRYKGDLRDPAFTRNRQLTSEEKIKVNRADGGEHWVKVTFESSQAADAAVYASPQSVQGYLIYAEHYHDYPPLKDEACPDVDAYGSFDADEHVRSQSVPGPGFGTPRRRLGGSRSAGLFQAQRSMSDLSPPHSQASSQTLDNGNGSQSTATLSSATITQAAAPSIPGSSSALSNSNSTPAAPREADSVFCSKIPTAKRAALRSADEAHLPSQSMVARILAAVPILMWFAGGLGAMIGSEVPRKDDGEFDYYRASLYWKFIWWLDATFRLFGGEVMSATDKDD